MFDFFGLSKEEIEKIKSKNQELFDGMRKEFEVYFRNQLIYMFGSNYVKKYKEDKVIAKSQIDGVLNDLLERKRGLIISGITRSEKTMSLIYIYEKIIRFLSREAYKFMDPYLYDVWKFAKKIDFYSAPNLFSRLHRDGEIEIAPYILISDLGSEYVEPLVFSRFDTFIEDIYRSDQYGLVISTNMSRGKFKNREGWLRITRRLLEVCNYLEVGDG